MDANQIFSLNNKVALITGASKGIGEAIASFFAACGARVIINSRKQEDLDRVSESIRENGGDCVGYAANAGDVVACKELIAKVVFNYGGIDILVNNAATNPVFGPVNNCEEWAFDKIMSVNVKAPFELSKLVHPLMKARGGGSIINISSVAGMRPDPGLGIYSISKAALNMLTKVTAKEYGVEWVRASDRPSHVGGTRWPEHAWPVRWRGTISTSPVPTGRWESAWIRWDRPR